MLMPILESDRLVLRPLEENDAADIIRICSNPNIADKLARIPHPYPEDEALRFIKQQALGTSGIHYAITIGSSMIGMIVIKSSSERAVGAFAPAIGYLLDQAFWGKGYMQEAISRLLSWYMPLEPTEQIRASVFVDNIKSLNLLTKLGFQEVGKGKGYSLARDQHVPQIDLALSAAHYKEAAQ